MNTVIDTENRVILNVGGIRHETYKVSFDFIHFVFVYSGKGIFS